MVLLLEGKGVEHGILSSAFVVFVFFPIFFSHKMNLLHTTGGDVFLLLLSLLKRRVLVELFVSPMKKQD
jgi:hypothetical protein